MSHPIEASRALIVVLLATALGASACLRPLRDADEPPPAPAARSGPAPNDQELAALRHDLEAREAGLATATLAQADMAKKVEELTALNAELTERLRGAGASVEALSVERQRLQKELSDLREQREQKDAPLTPGALPGLPPPAPDDGPQARTND